ncbi:MAG TPA: hypothetical protein PLS62_05535, partial [Desulfobacteraceae bacterium]|nr:hypothetical protein [Desulfobacteraceae bacterium]
MWIPAPNSNPGQAGVYPELDSGLGILPACVFVWFTSLCFCLVYQPLAGTTFTHIIAGLIKTFLEIDKGRLSFSRFIQRYIPFFHILPDRCSA